MTARTAPAAARLRSGALAAALLAAAALSPGCYTTQLGLLRSGLDSLRTNVDTLQVRDSVAYGVLAETRRELDQQRDLLLSTRATSGSTMQEMFDHMSRLEGKLDDVMHRFNDWASRVPVAAAAPATGGGSPPAGAAAAAGTSPPAGGAPAATGEAAGAPAAGTLYDQATRDLTEGRYGLALQGYRDFLARFPTSDLADNAQYGAAECFFAQAAFDSAAAEYARVPERWPSGDRVPAALYKLGLCQERLGRPGDAKKTFEELIRKFPASSEAGLARDRLGAKHR